MSPTDKPTAKQLAHLRQLAARLGQTFAYPHTRAKLESHGIDVRTVDADELAKAEGGVTCCSLLVRT